MEILNKEFWEKRDAAMKRFMASKERKTLIPQHFDLTLFIST